MLVQAPEIWWQVTSATFTCSIPSFKQKDDLAAEVWQMLDCYH